MLTCFTEFHYFHSKVKCNLMNDCVSLHFEDGVPSESELQRTNIQVFAVVESRESEST